MTKFRFILILFATHTIRELADPPNVLAQPEKQYSAARYFDIGETKVKERKWTEALEAFNQCIGRNPIYADAYYARAMVRERFNQLDEALTDYNIYVELRPDHHEALFARAQLRFKLGQYQMAKEDFARLLVLPAGETSTVFFRQDPYTGAVSEVLTAQSADKGYIFSFLGLTESKLSNYERAVGWFDSALLRNPRDPDVLVNRGMAKEKNLDTAGAVSDYRKALLLDPQHATAKHNLGVLGKDANEPDGSHLIDQVIAENPHLHFAYAERGFRKLQSGELRAALADYDQAIRLDSTEEEYYLNRGLIREKLKDYDGAYADYSDAISLKENFAMAWLNRGNLFSRLERFHDAIDDYSVAITIDPAYATAYYNRAIVRNRVRQSPAACQDLITAERLGATVTDKLRLNICRKD